MLSDTELDQLKNWKYSVEDRSILSAKLQPLWNALVALFPTYVHPNLISLAGFLCILYGYILTLRFSPNPALVLAQIALTITYTNLDSIDGKQARRTGQSSSIGELFDHALDNVGMVFLLLSYFNLWEVRDHTVINQTVFLASMGFLSFHLVAYLRDDKKVIFGTFTGQTEAICAYCVLCLLSIFRNYLPNFVYDINYYIPYLLGITAGIYVFAYLFITAIVWGTQRRYIYSMFGIAICYTIRFFGTFGSIPLNNQLGYIAEGMMLSIPTTEIILCKMSDKEFNPMIVVLMMASVLDNMLAVVLSMGYYCYMFFYLSEKLDLPMFRVRTRVYCSGVFDMCHRGHMVLFKNAAKLGDQLIVGVHTDEDVASYKRKPTVSHEERCETVGVCKYVSEVVRDPPLYLTKDFILKHRINVVVASEEYDSADDKYYAVPRKMGILRIIPRSAGVSSTDLLRIVMSRMSAQTKNAE